MPKIYASLLSIILLVVAKVDAQITVAGSTGANGTYTSLTKASGAFAALNAQGIQAGNNITITITADVITEDGVNSLNQPTTSSWTSLTISPVGARIISGTGVPMINFNGADNVTINGLNASGNSLTISNTSASTTSNTYALRFIADATNNTITNCTILAQFNSTTISANGGCIGFSTGTTTGNDNNTVSNCNLSTGGTTLTKCINGNGSTTSTAIENSGISITNCNLFDYFVSGAHTGIYITTGNQGWSITNNRFYQTGIRTLGSTGTTSAIFVSNTANNAGGFTITGNIIGYASNSQTGTMTYNGGSTLTYTAISYLGSATSPSLTTISNNIISDFAYTGTSTGSSFTGISNTTSNTSQTEIININGNTVRNISFAAITSSNLVGINAGSAATLSCNSNIISSLTRSAGSTGSIFGIQMTSPASATFNNNSITNLAINSSSSTGAVYGIYSNTSAATITANTNTITNLTNTGTSSSVIIAGIYEFGGAGNKTFQNNIINTFSGGGSATIYGINEQTGTTNSCNGNVINSFSGALVLHGILLNGGTTNNVFKNKIFDLLSTNAAPTVSGITVSAGTTNTISNNLIGDLRATAANSANAIIGVNITGGTTNNIYYNTVYLNGSSSGAVFGSSAVSASATPTVDMRNNILINTSTANSTGLTVAYRRASTTLTTYASASNSNDLYAGIPSTSNLIFYDGTTGDQTLAAYKTRTTPRDAASVSENPPFLSTTGSAANFLHINTATPTQVEGTGTPISGVADDYDGDARNVSTPDIGADEFAGTQAISMSYVSSNSVQQTGSTCNGTNNVPILRMDVVTSGSTNPLTLTSLTINGNGTSNLSDVSTYRIYYTGTSSTFNTSTPINVAASPLTTTDVVVTPSSTITLAQGTNYFWLVYNISSTATGPSVDGECTSVSLSTGGGTPSVTAPAGTLTVNVRPTVTASPTSATYCTGGTAVTLSAGGASTYSWSPSAGLSANSGASVTASPTTTTTYTVTGTDGNGCTNTATSVISVVATPTISSTTATPSTVCSGASSQLQVNVSTIASRMIYSNGTGQALETITTPTTLTALTSGSIDDGYITIAPASFAFNYNGTNYSSFGISTNGYVVIGGNATTIPSTLTSVAGNVVYAFGRDGNLNTTNGGSLTHGAASGGKYVFQINKYSGGASGAESSTIYVSYQIVLWGSTSSSPGRIDIIYGTSAGTPGSGGVIGIKDASGNFTNGINGSTSASSTTSIWPGSGTIYSFAPPPYTYSWSPTTFLNDATIANPLASNVTVTTAYTITVNNGSCSATGNVTVSLPSPLSTTVNSASRCSAAGPTTLTAVTTGGASPFGYTWSPTTDLYTDAAGTLAYTGASLILPTIYTKAASTINYSVTVTDNCTTSAQATSTVTVTQNPTATASSNSPLCSGNILNLMGGTNNGTTYVWTGPNSFTSSSQNPSINNVTTLASGTYSFVATVNGCSSAASTTTVIVNSTPGAVTITPSSLTVCSNGSTGNLLTASGGSVSNISILSENFNTTAPGWTVSNSSTGGTTANAAWTLRSNGYTYSSTTFNSNDASQFVLTNSDAQGSSGTLTSTVLQSPAFSTVGFSACSIQFYHYFRFNASPDVGTVEISTNGTSWTAIQSYTATVGTSTGFVLANLNLNSYINNPTVYIRFRYNAVYGYYWAVDNVSITGTQVPTFTWSPTSGLYIDAAATTPYTGAASTTVYAKPLTTTTYTATATSSANCTNTNTVVVTVNENTTWIGTTTNAATASNWSCGVPTSTSDAIIPTTPSGGNMPVLTANFEVRNLNLQSGATLTINSNVLTLAGAVTGTGTFTGIPTSSMIISAAAGTISFTTGSSLNNLTLANASSSATLGSPLNIFGAINLSQVASSLDLNGQLVTLKSTATATARVADLTNSILTGATNITVERFIGSGSSGPKEAWRLITSPLKGSNGSLFSTWQNGGVNTVGVGTYITAPSYNSSTPQGLDAWSAGHTAKSWSIATQNFVNVENTNSSNLFEASPASGVGANNGYFVFISGDRDPAVPAPRLGASTTVLSANGTLQTGDLSFATASAAAGDNTLVGNPYASAIDLNVFRTDNLSSNIKPSFYYWDPYLSGTYGVGGYVTVSYDINGVETIAPTGATHTRFLSSGQAMYTERNLDGTGAASVTFKETQKSAALNPGIFRTSAQVDRFPITLRSNVATPVLLDGIEANFSTGYAATVDNYDASKFFNISESFGFTRNNTPLAIERRPDVTSADTLFLTMRNMKVGSNYQFEFNPSFNAPGLIAFIQDSYTPGSNTPVNLSGTSTYNFNITSAAGSQATNRFRIVFAPSTVLPVTITSIKAFQQNSNIAVEWKTENESNMSKYEVERSTDGRNFSKVTTMAARNLSTAMYNWLDVNPAAGNNYYRVRTISNNGDGKYTQVVKVYLGKGEEQIVIYPNPVTDGNVNLQMNNMAKGNYTVRLVNGLGQVMQNQLVIHQGSNSTESIKINKALVHGTYTLEVIRPDGEKISTKLIY